MPEAFIIMQIGDEQLDTVCGRAIVPALKHFGYDPKRVDKHNEGGLLKSEIIEFIGRAELIVADLTNARPNCYLEVGYAMGIGKIHNLILTAREDHNPDSPNYVKGGPKIHFDLIGYDILFWDFSDLGKFQTELTKRIQRRRLVLAPSKEEAPSPWDEEWIEDQRVAATPGWQRTKQPGLMEIRFALDHPKPSKSHQELNQAAQKSQIQTFGWPIGVYLVDDESKPRPRADGIVAKTHMDIRAFEAKPTYDYWALRTNGDYFLWKTIFEDLRAEKKLFIDTRIVRVTETLLYCARLYSNLGIDPTTIVNIAIRHGGLVGRTLVMSSVAAHFPERHKSMDDGSQVKILARLSELETSLVQLVKQVTSPLFTLFDFTEVPDPTYEKIVDDFVNGRIA